MKKKKRIFI